MGEDPDGELSRASGFVATTGGVGAQVGRRSKRALKYLALALIGFMTIAASRSLWWGNSPAAAAARKLRDGDASKRIIAIGELEGVGQEDPGVGIPAMRSTLKDGEPRVRAAGAQALVLVVRSARQNTAAQAEVSHAVADLLQIVRDPAVEVRASGIRALGMIATVWDGPVGVVDRSGIQDALLGASADPDSTVRIAAVRALGAIGPTLADAPPPALLAALEDDAEGVRTAAANSLVAFRKGLPRWLPVLIRSFEKARPEARPAYALVVEAIQPRTIGADVVQALSSALSSPDEEVRCLAASSLRAFGEAAFPAIPALAASIGRPGRERKPAWTPPAGWNPILTPDDWNWWSSGPGSANRNEPALTAALTLLRILPGFPCYSAPPIEAASLDAMAEALRSGTPEVRASVAYALGRLQPTPAFVPLLGGAVRDSDAAVRAAALKALHDIADRMRFAPPETIRAALEDRAPAVRYWAAGALGHIQLGLGPYIAELLRLAEFDPDSAVRAVCVHEVEDMTRPTAATPAVVPVLTLALDRPDRGVRRAACALLARLGPASAPAIPRLRELANSPDPDLKDAARQALVRLKAAD
jgi:HEAT repeat protein